MTIETQDFELDSDLDALLADVGLNDIEGLDDVDGLDIDGLEEFNVEEPEDQDGDIVESKSDVITDDDLNAELEELLGEDFENEIAAEEVQADSKLEADNADLYNDEDEDFEEEVVSAAPATKQEDVEKNKKKASKTGESIEKPKKATKKASPAKKSDEPKKESKPRGPSVAGLSKSEALKARLGDNCKTLLVLDEAMKGLDKKAQSERIDQLIADVDGLPKKVGEKVLNFFQHLNTGVSLSVYSQIAIDMLVENGSISTTELRDKYLDKYSKGTASAQASQLIQVIKFLKLGVAAEGNKVAINDDSIIIDSFKSAA